MDIRFGKYTESEYLDIVNKRYVEFEKLEKEYLKHEPDKELRYFLEHHVKELVRRNLTN